MINARNKNEDKSELLDITGMGATVFSSLTYPDGTAVNTVHSNKITLSLLSGVSKAGGYQLVFLPEGEPIPNAVDTQNGLTSIFFSMNSFLPLSQKLEQSLTAKRKYKSSSPKIPMATGKGYWSSKNINSKIEEEYPLIY